MPWPVYSEKLIGSAIGGAWVRYTVPAGRRAIVTDIHIVNLTGSPATVALQTAGLYALYSTIQASTSLVTVRMRVVVYAGQVIETNSTATGVHVQVFGYLLEDITAADPPYRDVTYEKAVDLDQLPAANDE